MGALIFRCISTRLLTMPAEGEAGAQKRRRSSAASKPEKDPNAPKKPPSAYFAWFMKNRAKVVDEIGTSNTPKVAKHAAQQWAAMDQEVKNKLMAKYHKLKEAYVAELAEYKQSDAYKAFEAAQKEKKTQSTEQPSNGHASMAPTLQHFSSADLIAELARRFPSDGKGASKKRRA